MPEFTYDNGTVEIDDKGYLVDFAAWNHDLAAALARDEGIDALTDDHWKLIDFLRAYQAENGHAPMIRVLCKQTGLSLQRIYDLFEKGPARGACRVAGLPRPDSCV